MNKELRKKIYSPKVYSIIETIVILCTLEIIISFVLSTYNPPYSNILFILDFISITFLSFEFIYRYIGVKSKKDFFRNKYNIIDTFVIIAFVFYILSAIDASAFAGLKLINTVRILMVLRIIKFKDLNLSPETVNFITIFIFSFLLSCLIWLVENNANPGINNFGDAFYFTVVSLTTIGYGDITPKTQLGKIIIVLAVIYVFSGLITKAKYYFESEHHEDEKGTIVGEILNNNKRKIKKKIE